MQYYLINESDVQTASDNNIVATWLEDHDCPGVVVTTNSTKVFGNKEVVSISETEE